MIKKKDLTTKILFTMLLSCCFAAPDMVAANDLYGNETAGNTDSTNGNATVLADQKYDDVYGGKAVYGKATANTATIAGGAVTGAVYGGRSEYGNAIANTATVNGGTIGVLYGGISVSGEAKNNTANANGGTVNLNVIGGFSNESTVSDNTANIGDITSVNSVYGGLSIRGAASNNKANIKGSTILGNAYGGSSDSGSAENNSVTMNNGTVNMNVYGGSSSGSTTSGNTVNISGGTIAGVVHGGSSEYGDVKNNSVTVNGGTIKQDVIGGSGIESVVSGNTVNISGGTIERVVYGGSSESGNSENNSVTISGGTISKEIYGGYSKSGNAFNNIVTISGSPDISTAAVYGGYSTDGNIGNNTLTVNTKNIKVKKLANFHTLNFNLPADTKNGETVITVTDGGVTNIGGAQVNGYVPGDTVLRNGDKVILLNNNAGIETTGTTYTGKLAVGVSVLKEVTVKKEDENNIVLTVAGDNDKPNGNDKPGSNNNPGGNGKPGSNDKPGGNDKPDSNDKPGGNDKPGSNDKPGGNDKPGSNDKPGGNNQKPDKLTPDTKSFAETFVAAAAFLNQGADLLADAGIAQAKTAAKTGNGEWEGFITAGGNKLKIKTGSHVNIDGYNLSAGVAKNIITNNGKLLFAPVFEYGNGSYDSYLDNGLHGEGKTSYTGGGIIVRQENNDGVYYEGSVRAGRVKTDYKAGKLVAADGKVAAYDTDGTYFGAHVGIGKIKDLQENRELEYYGKFFYSRTGSTDAKLTTGEKYNFDSVDSERLRLGTRYAHRLSKQSKLYTGLAWEYEFGGEATAHFNQSSTASPSLKGSTGLLELGWQIQPGDRNAMNLDLNMTGKLGQQKGLTFRAAANWTF